MYSFANLQKILNKNTQGTGPTVLAASNVLRSNGRSHLVQMKIAGSAL